jgi:hypothetical protein
MTTTTFPIERQMTVGRDGYLTEGVTGIIFPSTTGMDHLFVEVDGLVYRTCPRCLDGSGTLEQHSNVFGGVCFACDGRALGTLVKGGKAEIAKIVARREYQRVRTEAKRLARVTARADEACRRWQEQIDQWHAEAIEIDKARDTQRWAAPVGQGVEVAGTVRVAMRVDTMYGSTCLIVIDSGDGVVVKVFSSSKAARALERGQAVLVAGQVKSHEIYQDVKQTVVARPVFTTSTA